MIQPKSTAKEGSWGNNYLPAPIVFSAYRFFQVKNSMGKPDHPIFGVKYYLRKVDRPIFGVKNCLRKVDQPSLDVKNCLRKVDQPIFDVKNHLGKLDRPIFQSKVFLLRRVFAYSRLKRGSLCFNRGT